MSGFSNAAKETTRDVRDASRESGAAATSASAGIEADLTALREDAAKLAQQIGDIFAARGDRVLQRARNRVDETLSGAREKGGRPSMRCVRSATI